MDAIARTSFILDLKDYAESLHWSKPLPNPTPGAYLSILARQLHIEP